ncbi:hypothetical protein H696_04542 [Fonticula alba]|uniref:CTLH domain-containing protein n=1 Tax=Fonticula alba TaxID=691883 RepID=A0A058Z6H1_FONAL|nr:hypothetical protein H696_04542 [Fonticula alba]KCV69127.1 hypothetical protein H696_04542 [Fonticula alba]|eukprot:XP_009496698.1 hypothetical protein H696_04542 [Fonticula alba]
MSAEIETTDIVRLIIQFLKENNLGESARSLEEEADVHLNTVASTDEFVSDVLEGRWDEVLAAVAPLRLPPAKLIDLYEQIVIELIELRELQAARALLSDSIPLASLRTSDPGRHNRLETLTHRSDFSTEEAYGLASGLGVSARKARHDRRAAIAQALAAEVVVVAPSRLVTLLGQALKWQKSQGILDGGVMSSPLAAGVPVRHNIFQGTTTQESGTPLDDAPPKHHLRSIRFPSSSRCTIARFAPNGRHLLTGASDGLIEAWDYVTGRRATDVAFQSEDNMLFMKGGAVYALSFNQDGSLLAAGDESGAVQVWHFATGKTARRFPKAHTQAVSALAMSRCGRFVLTGSHDHSVRLFGMDSGHQLREMRGHTAPVTDVAHVSDRARIISSSSDGTVRVWSVTTGESIASFRPRAPSPADSAPGASMLRTEIVAGGAPIFAALLSARDREQVIVCARSPVLSIMTLKGQPVAQIAAPTGDDDGDTPAGGAVVDENKVFLAAALSYKSTVAFAATTEGRLYTLRLDQGTCAASMEVIDPKQVGTDEVLGVAAHPHSNIIATWSLSGGLRVWRP